LCRKFFIVILAQIAEELTGSHTENQKNVCAFVSSHL